MEVSSGTSRHQELFGSWLILYSILMAARQSITQMAPLTSLELHLCKTRHWSNLQAESSVLNLTKMVRRLLNMQTVLLQCFKTAASQTIEFRLNHYMFHAKSITKLMAALRRLSLMEQSAQLLHLPALIWMT
jgi:hypothetical protein